MDSKNENRVLKIVLSLDSFTTGYSVMLILFALPFAVTIKQEIAFGMLALACGLPVAIIPLIYTLLHRFDPLLFGRYHLFMPISAILSAIFFVLFFGAGAGSGGACLVFFCLTVHIIFAITYRYCSFSVRARLVGDSVFKPSIQGRIISAVSAIIAVVVSYAFYTYDPSTALLNSAYVLASVCIILAMVQYLTSYYDIPRLGGKRVQSVKSVYRTLFDGLKKRTYFSSTFYVAAFAVMAITLAFLVIITSGGEAWFATVVVAVAVVSFFAVGHLCTEYMNKRTWLPSVMELVLALVAAVFLSLPIFVSMPISVERACFIIGGIVVGGGGAIALRQMRLRFLTIKRNITSGAMYILYELTLYVATGIAVLIAMVVALLFRAYMHAHALVIATATAVVFAIVGFVVSTKRTARADDIKELSYELKTSDIGGAVAGSGENNDEIIEQGEAE